MRERSVEWLRQQELNKRFCVCRDAERSHVSDPDSENQIVADSWKHAWVWMGDGFRADEQGFSFRSLPTPRREGPDDPFSFITPVYTCYRYSWANVTGVFEGKDGYVYIFAHATGDGGS